MRARGSAVLAFYQNDDTSMRVSVNGYSKKAMVRVNGGADEQTVLRKQANGKLTFYLSKNFADHYTSISRVLFCFDRGSRSENDGSGSA